MRALAESLGSALDLLRDLPDFLLVLALSSPPPLFGPISITSATDDCFGLEASGVLAGSSLGFLTGGL